MGNCNKIEKVQRENVQHWTFSLPDSNLESYPKGEEQFLSCILRTTQRAKNCFVKLFASVLSCSVAFPNLQVLLQEQVCVCIIKSVNTELGNWLSYKAALLVKNATVSFLGGGLCCKKYSICDFTPLTQSQLYTTRITLHFS